MQKLARFHLAQHSVSPDKTGLRKLSMLRRTWLKGKTKGHLLSWLQLPDSVFRHLQKAMFCVARDSCSYLLGRSWVCASVPQGSWDEAIRNRQFFLNQDLVPASPPETEWQTVITSQVFFNMEGNSKLFSLCIFNLLSCYENFRKRGKAFIPCIYWESM